MDNLKLVKPEPQVQEQNVVEILKAQHEFFAAFNVPISAAAKRLYVKLVDEEHEEWIEEYYSVSSLESHELKELTDLLYVTAGLAVQCGFNFTTTKSYQLKDYYDYAISDIVSDIVTEKVTEESLRQLMYCILAYADAMGWNVKEAYRRVHKSNMSKLGTNGKPVLREDGKVLKGPNYAPPVLDDLVNEE